MLRHGEVLLVLGFLTAGCLKSTSTSGVHRVRCNVGATTSSLQLSLQLISIEHRICVVHLLAIILPTWLPQSKLVTPPRRLGGPHRSSSRVDKYFLIVRHPPMATDVF
jgi:hypothetical protein